MVNIRVRISFSDVYLLLGMVNTRVRFSFSDIYLLLGIYGEY